MVPKPTVQHISHRLSLTFTSRYIVIVHLFVCLSCHIFFCFSFSVCPSACLSLSPNFSVFLPSFIFLFYIYFFRFFFLSFFHSCLSFFFFLSLSVSICLSLCLNGPLYECVSHCCFIVSMSQKFSSCLAFVTTLASLSASLIVVVGFLCIDTTFVFSIFLSLLGFSLSHTACARNSTSVFPSLWGTGTPIANCKLNIHGANQGISHCMYQEYTILILRIGTLLPECKNQCWCMSTGHT